MKLYLSVDMEGITGLPDYTYVDASEKNYERARRIMTEETNHVIEAAFAAGCQEVLVNDSHSKMNNILINELHPEATLITGDIKPLSMMQGIDATYTGAMFIGYHASAPKFGVMSHSMIHAVRNMYINDHVVGEMGLNAYVAGHYGVPLLLVTGDDQACLEAKELVPNVSTVAVKQSISRSAVKSLTPKKAGDMLAKEVKAVLAQVDQIQPLTPPKRPVLTIEFNNHGQAEWAHLMPGTKLEDNTTRVSFQAEDMPEAIRAMLVMTELAMQTTFS